MRGKLARLQQRGPKISELLRRVTKNRRPSTAETASEIALRNAGETAKRIRKIFTEGSAGRRR